jgi:hypothetical protein
MSTASGYLPPAVLPPLHLVLPGDYVPSQYVVPGQQSGRAMAAKATANAAAAACLEFVPGYQVLVCLPRSHAVRPSELSIRFSGPPHQTASVSSFPAGDAAVDAIVRRLAACGPDELVLPGAGVPWLLQLLLSTDGLQFQLTPRSFGTMRYTATTREFANMRSRK